MPEYTTMMRKKNITLNGKKAVGNEQLKQGDVIKLFLAEETIENFIDHSQFSKNMSRWRYRKAEIYLQVEANA